jgi:hypothetical protein
MGNSIWQQLFELVAGAARRTGERAAMDLLAAMDDLLTQRLTHCTVCGRRARVLDTDVIMVGRRSLAIVRCLPCRDADPAMAVVRGKLEQRYAEAEPL